MAHHGDVFGCFGLSRQSQLLSNSQSSFFCKSNSFQIMACFLGVIEYPPKVAASYDGFASLLRTCRALFNCLDARGIGDMLDCFA